MVRYFRICFLSIILVIMICLTGSAKLELSGAIFAELINDPLNFDPSQTWTSPWYSQGGSIKPGFYVGDFTRFNLNLRVQNNQAEVFLPLTIGVNPAGISGGATWQAFLVTEDYLNIPYYFTMKSPLFTISASSKPIGDKRFGFINLQDPLGVGRRTNSLQPLFTFRVDADFKNAYSGTAYIIYDQLVQGLPIWERLPESVAKEVLNGKEIGMFGFADELAQYNIARLERKLPNSYLGFFVGQKIVENPILRERKPDGSLSEGSVFTRWGAEKNNYGVDFQKKTANFELSSALVASNVKWYQYATQRETDYSGYFLKRWYPSELKGELDGLAASFSANWQLGSNRLLIDGIAVEPNFQSVGAVQDQFSPVELYIPRSNTDLTLERKTKLFFDPTGHQIGRVISSSPVVDYLGRRKLGITFTKEGQLASLPFTFAIRGQEISSLDKPIKKDKDSLTGAYQITDQRGIFVNLNYAGNYDKINLELENTTFLSTVDYRRSFRNSYERDWKHITLQSAIEGIWRLKELGVSNKDGSTLRFTTLLEGKLPRQTKYSLALDSRCGEYDYDLLEPISDQIVAQYSFTGISAYLEKGYYFQLGKRPGSITLAGELISRQTDLDQVDSGMSKVGFLDIDLPLGGNWRYLSSNVIAKGPSGFHFPSNKLENINHNELFFQQSEKVSLRLGHTLIGKDNHNLFAALTMTLGEGKLGVSLGRGPAPIFTEGRYLPGTMIRQDFYTQDYSPSQILANRPWSKWSTDNFNAMWQNKLRSTVEVWSGYVNVSYCYSF